jgi:sugar/nucleoside kinase (ribokinase family)
MSLIVTGTVGIDTVHTPTDSAEQVLGGSCVYFSAAASFFTRVRMVAAAGGDFNDEFRAVIDRFPNICTEGLETRAGSKTFAWGGRYSDDWNQRETLFTELGVLAEAPPTPPESYQDSKFIFLANSHPAVQRELLHAFPDRMFAVADTMNLWIDTERGELDRLLREIDGLVINDEEAQMLTGRRHTVAAGKQIIETMGPMFVVIKKGEHGCLLVHDQGVSILPAFPTERVVDPTGAGDSFAGGMMGYLAASHSKDFNVSLDSIRTALAHGTVIASFNIESFSLDRLAALTREEIAQRYEAFQQMVSFGRALTPSATASES